MVEEVPEKAPAPVMKRTRRAASRPAGPAVAAELPAASVPAKIEPVEQVEKPAKKVAKKAAKKAAKAKAPLFQVAAEVSAAAPKKVSAPIKGKGKATKKAAVAPAEEN